MKRYEVRIDNGDGGTTSINARNDESALNQAERWMRGGTWPVTDRHTVDVALAGDGTFRSRYVGCRTATVRARKV